MSLQFAVVHEAPADFQTATELADRVLVESIDWMEEDLIEHHRTWIRESSGVPLTWKRIKQSALDAGINAIGFFDGAPAQPDARAARRAILYLRHALPDLTGVLLIRDQDDQPERRLGLDQARRQEEGRLPVVVGLAVVERESWVISGFDPQDVVEESRLAVERQTLGLDPGCEAMSSPRARTTAPLAARSAFFARSAVETPIANAAAGAKHCWRPYVTVARRMDWARFWTRYGRNSAA